MGKSIGFEINHKHTLSCLAQVRKPNRYRKLRRDVVDFGNGSRCGADQVTGFT